MFPYVSDAEHHPDDAAIVSELAAADRVDARDAFERRFGAVYMSAGGVPRVLLVLHHLHPFFTTGPAAMERARREAEGGDVQFDRYRFDGPADEAFEFVVEDHRVELPVQGRPLPERDTFPLPPVLPPKLEERLKVPGVGTTLPVGPVVPVAVASTPAASGAVSKKIPSWELVPPVPYTWWCVPTAYNMVMGFWDHYVPGRGRFTGHGRIVDHWFEHTVYAHRADGWDAKVGDPGAIPNDVPSITDELVDPATRTWRTGFADFVGFVAQKYHYEVATGPMDGKNVGSHNDWAWDRIVQEVDAGRPFFWCFGTHCVVGIGYRVDGAGSKWVIYLDTYGATLTQKLKELPHSKGNGFTWLTFGVGDSPADVTLLNPRGGEQVHAATPAAVSWYVDGTTATEAGVSVSHDAGRTWQQIGPTFPTGQGFGSFRWLPAGPTIQTRVRVRTFAQGVRLAGDGSITDVACIPQTSGGHWVNISGPIDRVVAGYDKRTGTRAIFTTETGTGDIYQFHGKPGAAWNWLRVGGPCRAFVLDANGVLFGLSPDGQSIWKYEGVGTTWSRIGGPASAIYPDVDGVLAIEPATADVLRYLGTPFSWRKVGGPGASFAVDGKGMLYGVSPDHSGLWRYTGLYGQLVPWTKVGGPTSAVFARGLGVYATDPHVGAIRFFHGQPDVWTQVGGPGQAFTVDTEGRLYGLSPGGGGVWRYDGCTTDAKRWTQIGQAAGTVCAGHREILATNPTTKELWLYVE